MSTNKIKEVNNWGGIITNKWEKFQQMREKSKWVTEDVTK